MDNDDVLFRREGVLGHITLNRPKSLNALTLDMCAAMLRKLQEWGDDPAIHVVLIDAVPGRAFCAGGDIRAIHEKAKKRDGSAREFFATEYRLNAAIKHFPKPYVALIDGIAMGGATGISVHGPYRVVGDNAVYAMPETAIGLFPDVGGTFVLPRLPGEIGMYLALTGARIGTADMMYAGIATHYIRSQNLGEIPLRLAEGEPVEKILTPPSDDPETTSLAEHRASIDRAFAAGSVEAVLEALKGEGQWGRETTALLATRSPTGLKLTFRAMREGRVRDFADCQRMEYRLMARAVESHDFDEGIRATLIDKDQRPIWRPETLAAVTDPQIERYFASLEESDVTFL